MALLAIAVSLALLVGPAAARAATQLQPVSYTDFDGHAETLVPWQGEKVVVLTDPRTARDPDVMTRLVGALDRAYGYYADTTGRTPALNKSLNGRDTVAEVPHTCGAGCGYLGSTGIEVQTDYFESMYREVAQNDRYSQIPFYELGRNFWFWSPQLEFKPPEQDPVITGFAVWMRFRSMAAAGVNGAPFNGVPFSTFASQVAGLASQYEADPSLTFAQTLAQGKSPGAYGGTDFWASLMMQLARRHGGQEFVTQFWHSVAYLPAATSTAGAVANWVKAASYAAGVDLKPVFYQRWGFPRPDGSVTERPPASAVPEPTVAPATRPVGTNADGRQQIFLIGSDSQLYTKYQVQLNGGWSGWTSFGGSWPASDAIGAGHNLDGRQEIYLVGNDHQLYTKYQTQVNGGWSGWVSLGGWWPNTDSIGVGMSPDGRQRLYLIGYDHTLYVKYQTRVNGPWSDWASLGGRAPNADAVGVGRNADGREEVYLVGFDDRLWTKVERPRNAGWSQWFPLPGLWPNGDAVGVGQNADGRQELYLIGTDSRLYTQSQTSPNGFWSTSWSSLEGSWRTTDSIGVGQNADARQEIYLVGNDGVPYTKYQTAVNGGWSPSWISFGGSWPAQ